MKKNYLWLLVGIFLIPGNVLATPGWLSKGSITSCNGQYYGSHGDGHWHIAEQRDNRWYAIGEPLEGNPCGGTSYVAPSTPNNSTTNNNNNNSSSYGNSNNTESYQNANNSSSNKSNRVVPESPIVEQKSSDTSLKEIKIEDKFITISESLSYKTKKEKVKIEVVANDSKANIEYEAEKELGIGLNVYPIKVTAENGDVKNYNINITRLALSANKEFKLFYHEEELTKNTVSKTIEDINVENDITRIALKYKLSDTKAKITITGNDKLKVGNNKIKITIVAENQSKDTYTLTVHRNSKVEDIVETLLSFIIIILVFVFPIRAINRKRKKNYNIT